MFSDAFELTLPFLRFQTLPSIPRCGVTLKTL
jgi:hypothetical protein